MRIRPVGSQRAMGNPIWKSIVPRFRLLILCVLYRIVSNSYCIKLTKFKMKEITFVGSTTTLECNYDLEGEQLYSIKWYKDRNEFYRFLS
ncbi:Uncharacterized protein FWK35_00014991 [Aphis craccivora]|uniref:Ig-like domain-containing protein n=1 Tax=Aphis craccivora TaxID=307492 RepID=A0A6G0Y6I6_APHCR|nr:Uncharacterized protein FWK35_00014991 [Aphis craccivora]